MSNINTENFEKQWEKFIFGLKGKMLTEGSKQPLSYSLCKLLLADARLNWTSNLEENGRWLKTYRVENPEKGQLIYNILTEDISFTEIEAPKQGSKASDYVVPAVGAVAGFGISSIFRADLIIRAIATIIPAVLLFTTGKARKKSTAKHSTDKALIDAYIEQLEKYKISVISVLEN